MAKSATTTSDASQEAQPYVEPNESNVVEVEGVEGEIEEVEEVSADSLYQKICDTLETECEADESIEDFKIRVVTEFSDMNDWPNDKYEELDQDIQDWVFDATTTHKGNMTRKRKKAFPALPGLDHAPEEKKKRGRASLVDEPKPERKRTSGNDCLTRTMKELANSADPEKLTVVDLMNALAAKYNRPDPYSKAAVRYAQQAFLTARRLLAEQKTPA